jgi:hypothetical protein
MASRPPIERARGDLFIVGAHFGPVAISIQMT